MSEVNRQSNDPAISPYNSLINHGKHQEIAKAAGCVYIPETDEFWDKEKIVQYCVSTLKDEDFVILLSLEKEEMIKYHHSIGRWIRNTFKLWFEDNPTLNGKHPDDVSGEILEGIWETVHLREKIGL